MSVFALKATAIKKSKSVKSSNVLNSSLIASQSANKPSRSTRNLSVKKLSRSKRRTLRSSASPKPVKRNAKMKLKKSREHFARRKPVCVASLLKQRITVLLT